MSEKESKSKALEKLVSNNTESTQVEKTNTEEVVENNSSEYRQIQREDLPFGGILYPESWKIAYRCPTPDEIADFSTINEEDQAGIMQAISDLVKNCFVIFDSENKKQISSSELNDGEKMFYFLKLREFYLDDNAEIKYVVMNQTYNEMVEIAFNSASLQYPELSEKLLSTFDGRCFSVQPAGLTEPIKFHIPTINISQKIFKYILNVYKEIENKNNGKQTKNVNADKKQIDKKFLLILPFLFVTGDESVQSLRQKFVNITKNDRLYRAYISLANNINLTNYEKISYIHKESEEEALIKFPMGWRKIFDDCNYL